MLFLALRYLLSRRRQTFLTMLGILLGTAGYVVISGIMLGFRLFIIDQLINNDAHIRISSREEPITEHSLDQDFFGDARHVFWISPPSGRRDNPQIEYAQGWFDRLDGDPRVLAYSPQFNVQALFRRAKISQTARLIGCDPAKQERITDIQRYMLNGKFSDIGQSGNRIVVGDGLLQNLGARVSENVLISVGKGNVVPFKIVGVFHIGMKTIDETTAFGSLNDVQKANLTPSQISDIAVRLADVGEALPLAQSWASTSRDKVQSWDQANSGMLSVFKTQDIVRNSMTLTILVVAGFGIYNILNMMVNQKKREIAILRSIGYEARDIILLFLVQGLILGATGGLTGMALGFAICKYLGTITVDPGRLIGGGGSMMISYLPSIYANGFLLAFGSAVLASLFPARSAAKLLPIEIIRSEGT